MRLTKPIQKFICHGRRVLRIAREYGWLPGARYTNLRDVREFDRLGFLDIDWRSYSFQRHLAAAKATRPMLTVARDVLHPSDVQRVCNEAASLAEYADAVIVVLKSHEVAKSVDELIPQRFLLGYSVPTAYGGTTVATQYFKRPVHLLGGRPDVQRVLADRLQVESLDCNRFTLDAEFGDYFDGHYFRPMHAHVTYEACLRASFENINRIWLDPATEYESHGKRTRHHANQMRFDALKHI